MSVKSSDFVTPYLGMNKIYLEGTTTNLNPGDPLLIVGDERKNKKGSDNWDFRRVKELETFPNTDPDKAYTVVTLDRGLGSWIPHVDPAQKNPKVYALRQRAALFGANAVEWKLLSKDVRSSYGDTQYTWPNWQDPYLTISDVSGSSFDTIHLDAVYSSIIAESWIVLSLPTYQEVYRVKSAAEDSPAKFGLTTKSTKLTLTGENLEEEFNDKIRETVVLGESEELPWAKAPFNDAVFGAEITLNLTVSELAADRALLVSGLPARVEVTAKGAALELTLADGTTLPLIIGDTLSLTGPPVTQSGTSGISRWELKMADGTEGFLFANAKQLKYVAADESSDRLFEVAILEETKTASDGSTILVLTESLKYAYDPTTMLIYGNVAYATEGETTTGEVLGSGDATQANQSFELSKTPLTYIPTATVSGGESTLKITVNDVEWTEVSSLYDRDSDEHVYVTRLADDGKVTVMFGDGQSGARLPTGQDNVKATYRKGTGVDGLLKAEQLSLLITRPLGVKSVINPEATEGAADPQVLEDARENAPTTVLTLERVVSLQDYEDFARNFSGIAKALATWTWNAHSRGIFLTIAGAEGATISADSSTITSLRESLLQYGNPLVPIQIESYKEAKFELAGTVYVEGDHDTEIVGTAVNDALKKAFSFDARSFGQPVTLSEVEAVIQNVEGVSYVDLDALYVGDTSELKSYLAPQTPRDGAAFNEAAPAELLTLNEDSLSGLVVKRV